MIIGCVQNASLHKLCPYFGPHSTTTGTSLLPQLSLRDLLGLLLGSLLFGEFLRVPPVDPLLGDGSSPSVEELVWVVHLITTVGP